MIEKICAMPGCNNTAVLHWFDSAGHQICDGHPHPANARPQCQCQTDPIPMLLWCPECGQRHVDRGEFAIKPHHTHACQTCGHAWRPAVVATVGVQFLPGFKDADEEME